MSASLFSLCWRFANHRAQRWPRLACAAVLTALVALAPHPAGGEPTHDGRQPSSALKTTVSGRVLLPDGRPAAGAQIAVAGHRKWHRGRGDWESEILGQAITDKAGSFELVTPRTSTADFFDLFALAALDGYACGITPLDADSPHPTPMLQLGKEDVLRLTLIDLEGQPAAGVELFVYQIGIVRADWGGYFQGVSFSQPPERLSFWPRRMKSDDQGRVALGGFNRESAVNVIVADPRFSREGTLLGGGQGEKEPTLSLPPSQIIEGTVTYEDTGAPAPHARLAVGDADGVADELGHFRINPHAGSKMGITAGPADGEPYLGTHAPFEWPKGAAKYKIDMKLPRGILAQGRVADQDGAPIACAAVQYTPLRRNPNNKDSLRFGWDKHALTDAHGDFALAVLPGEGHLLIQGPHGDFIHQEIGNFVLDEDHPGGQRYYPDAVIRLDVPPDQKSVRADATLRRGVIVRGRLVGPDGEPVRRATIVSRLQLSNFKFKRGAPTEIFDGNFELHGLDPEQSYPVMFVATDDEWGATAIISGRQAGEHVTVQLAPCGTASVRFLGKDGRPRGGMQPWVELVVTPGVGKYEIDAQRKGSLAYEGDHITNLDRAHHWGRVRTDDMGRLSLSALIPGATYRFFVTMTEKVEFTAESGKNTELGEIRLPVE